jgi:hypothetical protein
MNKIGNVSTKIKFKCFGKVKNSRGMDADKELNLLYSKKLKANEIDEIEKVDDEIAEKLLKLQKKISKI